MLAVFIFDPTGNCAATSKRSKARCRLRFSLVPTRTTFIPPRLLVGNGSIKVVSAAARRLVVRAEARKEQRRRTTSGRRAQKLKGLNELHRLHRLPGNILGVVQPGQAS